MAGRALLSVHTSPETRKKLEALPTAQARTRPSLTNEALKQYVSHQEWLVSEVERGVVAADRGELVDDGVMEAWFRTIGAAN